MSSPISTFAFVRLIFLKDVRALRYPLLLLAALAVAFFYLDPYSNELGGYPILLVCLFLAPGVFLLAIPVMQADPSGREFRFLLTRPVPGVAVGVAKALFLILFLVLPSLLGVEFVVARSHVPLGPLDHLLLLVETFVPFGAGLAALVLCCVLLRKRVPVTVTIVILSLVAACLYYWWQQRPFQPGMIFHWPNEEQQRLLNFRTFLAEAVFLIAAASAVGLRYCTRAPQSSLDRSRGGHRPGPPRSRVSL